VVPAAPSAIPVLGIPPSLGIGPSKKLLLRSPEMSNSPNRINDTFRPNIPPTHPNQTYSSYSYLHLTNY